ncbi:peptidoglycan DD-metalloendopeptidase family protein [Longibacter sp.]|uniref:peptidoglycan DD-metalloendopeptidase family protein n=1 Tax=Longibacter sp. TaxID=2045415 RepID=UPI003EB79963
MTSPASRHQYPSVVDIPSDVAVFDFTEEYDPNAIEDHAWGIGRYDEHRAQEMYNNSGLYAEERCIHMGIDLWGPAGTPVKAFADGRVYAIVNHDSPRNYGPTVITEHLLDEERVWALHGHLSRETLEHLDLNQPVQAGDVLGWFGTTHENGGWPPHLHLQLSREEPLDNDMPGVVAPADREKARETYPDPRQVLGPIY